MIPVADDYQDDKFVAAVSSELSIKLYIILFLFIYFNNP